MNKIYSIVGPTASGKSKIAMGLSEYCPIEIISCDSRQVYKYMNIGTAKPTQEDLKKVKYHLIDIINPDKTYNAKLYSNDAEKALTSVWNRGQIPLIVGGTGMYLNALIYGLFDEKKIPIALRNKLRNMETETLYKKLQKEAPVSASRLNKNDRYRIIRALEIFEVTGKNIYEFQNQKSARYDMTYFYIIKDRGKLYEDINKRVDKMIKLGLIEEIESLLNRGYSFSDPGMITVGYKEFKDYFLHNITLDNAIENVKKNSRNYAKRQFTWFGKHIRNGEHYIIDVGETGIIKTIKTILKVIKKGITQ